MQLGGDAVKHPGRVGLRPLITKRRNGLPRGGDRVTESEKKSADLHQFSDTPQSSNAKSKSSRRSADKAAKDAGISGRAMAQWKRIRDKAPDLAERVRNGELALDRADRIIRDRDAERWAR